MTQNASPQPNTGPKCAHCGAVILPMNDVTRGLFATGRYDNAPGFLCAPCHAGQRELFSTGPDWYERTRAKEEAKKRAYKGRRR